MAGTTDRIVMQWAYRAVGVPTPVRATKPAAPVVKGGGKVGVGRNDPCPCGSGRKLKKCCLWVRAGRDAT